MPESIWLVEKVMLLKPFYDSSGACNIAKAQDHSESNLGSKVDLQLDDDRNRKNGKKEVGDAIHRTVKKAKRGKCTSAPAPRVWVCAHHRIPSALDGHALPDQCSSTCEHKADEEHCGTSAVVLGWESAFIPIEAHRKAFHRFPGGTSRIRKSAMETLTKTTPHMTNML